MLERQINLRKQLGIVWHWLWLLIMGSAVMGLAAYGYTRYQSPIYESASRLLINEAPGSNKGVASYDSLLVSERVAETYAQMIKSEPVLREALERLTGNANLIDVSQVTVFQNSVTVSVIRNTQLIRISVRDQDPARAARLTNALAEVFATQVKQVQVTRFAESKRNLESQIASVEKLITERERDLQTKKESEEQRIQAELAQYRTSLANLNLAYETIRLSEAQSNSTVSQIEQAAPATVPVWPNTIQLTLSGAFLGLLLAIFAVFALEALDNSVKDPDSLAQRLNLPILGFVPRFEVPEGKSGKRRSRPIVVEEPRSIVSEGFRSLRTNIEYSSVDKPLRTLLITSAYSGDGKSTVAANLGAAIAQSDKSVVMIDTDMRRPSLHRKMDTSNNVGLSTYFVSQDMPLEEVMQRTFVYGVSLIPSGPLPPNPAELLATRKMRDMLESVKASADLVLIDAPPIMPVTDAMVLAAQVDGVLLVVRAGLTRETAVIQIVEQMRRANINVIGIVINDVEKNRMRGYTYRRGQYYYNRQQDVYYGNYGEKKQGQTVVTSS
jgi:capsular exopolysaccharide synthesis family protein